MSNANRFVDDEQGLRDFFTFTNGEEEDEDTDKKEGDGENTSEAHASMRQEDTDDCPEVVCLYEALLGRFRVLSRPGPSSLPHQAAIFSRLIEAYRACRLRDELAEAKSDSLAREAFSGILCGLQFAYDTWRRRQASVAEDFNILDVMRITSKEVYHSMVLAWLLDHDLRRYGTHAQGKLGFELFLDAVRLPLCYAEADYWVRREVVGDESRVDIEIGARGAFLIHVENKIRAPEGKMQTRREWADLTRRAATLGVEISGPRRAIHAFFLTPEGRSAENPMFAQLSWATVASILEAFAQKALPPDVRLFSAHYARALRTFVVRELRPEEHEDE